jgi:hypothetical protein
MIEQQWLRHPSQHHGVYATRNSSGVPQDIGLPNPDYMPTEFAKLPSDAPVALDVFCDLCDPICGVHATGKLASANIPVSSVPEIAVAKDDCSRASNHDVGLSRQGPMQAITKTAVP